jgi:HPt (histidine-containing phosphotransfer) domain-containing protein
VLIIPDGPLDSGQAVLKHFHYSRNSQEHLMTATSTGTQDTDYLDIERALGQIGDVSALHEMLDMLQDSLDRDVPQISMLLQAHDVKAANRLLHSLKGFIPIFCVDALCDHVAQVEMLSKTQGYEEVGAAYSHLVPKLQQLQAEIDQYLG